MILPKDIEKHISKSFNDVQRVKSALSNLNDSSEKIRIIRCILSMSDSDYDAVSSWVEKANNDYRYIIWFAEYDERNIRMYDFNYAFNKQNKYSYPSEDF